MKIEKVKEFMKDKEKSRWFFQRVKYFLEIIKESKLRNKLEFKRKKVIEQNSIEMNDKIIIWWVPFLIQEWKTPESINEVEKILFTDDCDYMINLCNEFWYLPFYDEEYILFINEWEWRKYIQWKFLNFWINWNKWFFDYKELDKIYELYKQWKKLYLWSDSSLQRSIFVFEYIMRKEWLNDEQISEIKDKVSRQYENEEVVRKLLDLKFLF